MIANDTVKVRDWAAAPTLNGLVGVVRDHREVGKKLENIEYEYLVMFENGDRMWIPSRYLQRL